MEFAKQELAKYGWTEGKGLGRDESGIVKALKPLLKFDKAGMGHDSAETFTNHWWEKAFNAAADNITVNKYVDGSVTVDAENAFDIGDHKGISKKRKHLVYDNFVKTATLTNEGTVAEEPREAVEVPFVVTVPVLTDEELFRACGGRTAHKGARHGLGLNGKLARIEQQEKLLLNLAEKVPENVPPAKRKKSNKSKVSNDLDKQTIEVQEDLSINIDQAAENINNEDIKHMKKVKKSKKSKKDAHRIEEISPNDDQLENNSKPKRTGHKKSKISVEVSENLNEICLSSGEISIKRSKKMHREKDESSKDAAQQSVEGKTEERRREKKCKKSRDTVAVEEEAAIEEPSKELNKPNIADCGEATTETESSGMDKKEKKRKKRKCAANDVMDSAASTADNTGNAEEAIPTKKKKSRRKDAAE